MLLHGEPRTVNDKLTRDAGFTTILLETPFDALPTNTGRGLNRAIAAAEALQLIGGFSDPDLMLRIAPRFKDFLNGDGFHGAYGNRIKSQIHPTLTKLADEDTRRAVITLWDGDLDNLAGMRDYPCTVALQFQVEGGTLCMNTIMRSNDLWLGLPYDMFQFTQLQMTMANRLGLAYGWYRHTTMSLHVYDENVADLQRIHPPEMGKNGLPDQNPFQPMGVGATCTSMRNVMNFARSIAAGAPIAKLWNVELTLSDKWYVDALTPYTRGDIIGGSHS